MSERSADLDILVSDALSLREETEPRYVIHTAAEALQPQEPVEWIVDGLISANTVNLLIGEGGTKKTYCALDMGVCVATGSDWLDFATFPYPVLFIDEESGPKRLARRLGDVLRGHYADETTPLSYVSLAGLNFRDQAGIDGLHYLIGKTGARLVFVDALADVMLGGDENAVRDVQPVFHGLRTVANATEAAIFVIHHANRTSGGYRGSSAMHGAVDLMLKVESKTESPNIDFSCDKARDIEPVKFAATIHFEPGQVWLSPAIVTPGVAKLSKGERYVLRYLEDHGDSEVCEIMAHADTCAPGTARNAIYALTDRGRLERKDSGGPGEKAVYGLVTTVTCDL